MVKFASYAFNKYAMLRHMLFWHMRRHGLEESYPAEFMAALMTSLKGDPEHVAGLHQKLQRDGNRSSAS